MAQPAPRSLPPGVPSPLPGGTPPSFARALVVSLRPEQWTKNLIVFAALLFGRQLFDPHAVAMSVAAFAVFCALSGVVYLVNDVLDREADRRHPLKARRPIASGVLAPTAAIGTAAILTVGGLAAALLIGRGFFVTAAAYLVLLTLYSGPFKRMVILD